MTRLLRVAASLVLLAAAAGCGEGGKPLEPKARTDDTRLKIAGPGGAPNQSAGGLGQLPGAPPPAK